jgi:predicted nucleic acid-binding protein
VPTQTERWLIDTNVWIFGLRRDEKSPDSARLLQKLGSFTALIPLQIIKELHLNLTDREMAEFYGLLNRFPNRSELNWEVPSNERIYFYRKAGCRKGDAIVAASAERLKADLIISNNRQFLQTVSGLSTDIMTPSQALARLGVVDGE